LLQSSSHGTLLIVIMLLGHWIEMRALAQTSSALDSLAALLPDTAERGGPESDQVTAVAPAGTAWRRGRRRSRDRRD